jgi:hypothetical protein
MASEMGIRRDGVYRFGWVVDSGIPDEVSSCLLTALDGLVFPCLAGAVICETFLLE